MQCPDEDPLHLTQRPARSLAAALNFFRAMALPITLSSMSLATHPNARDSFSRACSVKQNCSQLKQCFGSALADVRQVQPSLPMDKYRAQGAMEISSSLGCHGRAVELLKRSGNSPRTRMPSTRDSMLPRYTHGSLSSNHK